MNLRPFLMATLLGVLAGCASAPTPEMRHADRLPDTEAGTASSGTSSAGPEIRREVDRGGRFHRAHAGHDSRPLADPLVA